MPNPGPSAIISRVVRTDVPLPDDITEEQLRHTSLSAGCGSYVPRCRRCMRAATAGSSVDHALGVDVEYLVEHLVADLLAGIGLSIATAAVRLVPATRLAITLIAPLRDERAAAARAFAAAVLWAGLARDAFTVTWPHCDRKKRSPSHGKEMTGASWV